MAAGLVVAGTASAVTAQGAARTSASSADETIRVVVTGGDGAGFDNKPVGDSIGDYFAFHSTLQSRNGKPVGRVDGHSVLTGTGTSLAYLHFTTLTLPRGQISTQNTELPDVENGKGPEAVTGGTGRYQNVGGQLTFEEKDNRVVVVIHLVR